MPRAPRMPAPLEPAPLAVSHVETRLPPRDVMHLTWLKTRHGLTRLNRRAYKSPSA
jgi:hypothetical protein